LCFIGDARAMSRHVALLLLQHVAPCDEQHPSGTRNITLNDGFAANDIMANTLMPLWGQRAITREPRLGVAKLPTVHPSAERSSHAVSALILFVVVNGCGCLPAQG